MLQRAVSGGGGSGGITHIESAFAVAGTAYASGAVTSSDGTITLGTWNTTNVTIIKKCSVIKRTYGQAQPAPVIGNIGDVIGISNYQTIMLIDDQD